MQDAPTQFGSATMDTYRNASRMLCAQSGPRTCAGPPRPHDGRLHDLSDRSLADIGIDRSEIEAVVQ